jgi:hypothetical protein
MTNKHIKRWSTPLTNREMQIKTTERYQIILFMMGRSKCQVKTNVGEDVEILEVSYIAGGEWFSVDDVLNRATILPSDSTPTQTGGIKSYAQTKKIVHEYLNSIMHNSQKGEAI